MNIKTIFESIKKTKAYRVYFVKAYEAKSLSIATQYVLIMCLLIMISANFQNVMNEYKPLEQLDYVKGKVVDFTPNGRKAYPKIILNVNGEQHGFIWFLNNQNYQVKNVLMNKDIKLWYLTEYQVWPFITDNYVAHILLDGEIIKNYNSKRHQFIEEQSRNKFSILIYITIIITILMRVWRKFSNQI